jgi:two-component system LytT family sensor kinase
LAVSVYHPSLSLPKDPQLLVSMPLKKRILYHILFWICYFSLYTGFVLYGVYKVRDPVIYLQLTGFFPLEIALVYLNFYFLMPKFLYAKKYAQYGSLLFLSILIAALLNIGLKNLYKEGSAFFSLAAILNFTNLVGTMIERVYLIGLTTGIKLAKDWVVNIQLMKEKEKQYLETELNFLKSQIQPHFFFNTLNNLYSLTLKKSDRAPDVVLKLSELMSYMLYESNTAFVSLDKEIDYLQNFMDLEQLRFGDRMQVEFDIEGKTENISIPPLILILFVENSFKHGVKNNLNSIRIRAKLKALPDEIFFSISNPKQQTLSTAEKAGIGLKNVKRRLDLLYGNSYILDMKDEGDDFTVSLKIPVV